MVVTKNWVIDLVKKCFKKNQEYVLLWENSNKSNEFNPTTLNNIDISPYKFILIRYASYSGNSYTFSNLIPIGDFYTSVVTMVPAGTNTTQPIIMGMRSFKVYDNSISITEAYAQTASETKRHTDNHYCTPYYIYGIR